MRLSVNTKVSMTSVPWSTSCRDGWVQTPPFSCRQETEGQWIEQRWSRQFNRLASQQKKLQADPFFHFYYTAVLFKPMRNFKTTIRHKVIWKSWGREEEVWIAGRWKGGYQLIPSVVCILLVALLAPWNAPFVDLLWDVRCRRNAFSQQWFKHCPWFNASSFMDQLIATSVGLQLFRADMC